MMYLNPTFCRGQNLSFFGLGPWAIIHGLAKLANISNMNFFTKKTPFERSLSKLSEKQKIVEIGSTEFKFWQLKESQTIILIAELVKHCYMYNILTLDTGYMYMYKR